MAARMGFRLARRGYGSACGELRGFDSGLVGPEAEAGVGDEIDIFAVDLVVAEGQPGRVIVAHHFGEVAIAVADAFDFLPRQLAGAPCDFETAFGCAVDQVGCRTEFVGKVGVLLYVLQRGGRSDVAVLADERVDGFVFAEFAHGGTKDDELSAVCEGHAGAVDGLVADPGGVEFLGVEIDDGFADGIVKGFEVDLDAELGGAQEALLVVADVKAADGESAIVTAADDRLHVNDGEMAEEALSGVVEHGADGVLRGAHDALHAVDRAEVVAAVDAFAAAGADEDVLVVVGHADDFVRDDLADGEYEIPLTVDDVLVDLGGP